MPSIPRLMRRLLFPALLLLHGCAEHDDGGDKHKREPREHLVAAVEVAEDDLSRSYERRGILKARRIVRIHTPEQGIVISLPWYEGDAVKEGDELVHLDDELLQAELAKESARLDKETQNLERLQRLTVSKAASLDELIAARTEVTVQQAEVTRLQTRIRRTSIRAPFAGIITERLLEAGDLATENSHILTLFDPLSLAVDIPLPEFLLLQFREGMQALVRYAQNAQGSDGWHPATISRIYPTIDESTGMGRMELKPLASPPQTLIGQRVSVKLETAAARRIAIPYQALQQSREGHFVYVIEAGKAHKRPVEAAFFGTRQIEISSGLGDGEVIVVRGFLGLEDGAAVKIVE